MQGPAEVSTTSLVEANALFPTALAGGAIPAQVEMAMQAEASRRQLDTIYLNIDAAKHRLALMDSRAKEAMVEWKLPQRLRQFTAKHPDVVADATMRELVVLEGKSNHSGSNGGDGQNPSARYIAVFPMCIFSDDAEVKEVESFAARFHDLEQEQNLLEMLLVHETRNLALAESQVVSKPRLATSSSPPRHKLFASQHNAADSIDNASTIQNDSEVDPADHRTPVKGQRGANAPQSPWTKYLPVALADSGAAAADGADATSKRADPAVSDDERMCAYVESLLLQSTAAVTRARELEAELDVARRQAILAKEEVEMANGQVRKHDEDRARTLDELRDQVALNDGLSDQLCAAAARRAAQDVRAVLQDEASRRQLLELEGRMAAQEAYGRTQLFARRYADGQEERATRKYVAERAVAESSDLARADAERERAAAVREAEQLRRQLAALEGLRQEQAAAAAIQLDAQQTQLHLALALASKKDEEAAEVRRVNTDLAIRLDIAASTSVSNKSVQRALSDQAARDCESAVKLLPMSTRYKSPVAGSIRSQLSERRDADRRGEDGTTLPKPRNVAPLPTSRDRGSHQ